MAKVCVLTTTKDRPVGLQLLNRWLSRQSYQDFDWLIVTDGEAGQWMPARAKVARFSVNGYRLQGSGAIRSAQTNLHSMLNNLVAGLRIAKDASIVIAEDDEYFGPGWLESMIAGLERAPLVGCNPSHYYHWPTRTYVNRHNVSHAALTCSAWRPEVTPFVLELCKRNEVFLDMLLWDEWQGEKYLFKNEGHVVSWKALPGTPGIGDSHRGFAGWRDAQFEKLESLIGASDAKVYRELAAEYKV